MSPVSHISPSVFATCVEDWYQQHGRKNLPWQQHKTPYKVWLSEVMLQQTQVQTVIPYFERFMRRYPDVLALAQASLDDVLSLWSGLGYYARARNLHCCAQQVVARYNGEFPAQLEELLSLPGIGRSTAGAIVTLAYDNYAPILDGNVKRVLARLHKVSGALNASHTNTRLWALSEVLTPPTKSANYTQAMMDIGALLCTRGQPNCAACPFTTHCLSYHDHTQLDYPTPPKRRMKPQRQTYFLLVLNDASDVLLEKREARGIWGGLWCFPSITPKQIKPWCRRHAGIEVVQTEYWEPYVHSFSHFDLTIKPILITAYENLPGVSSTSYGQWHALTQAMTLGISAPVQQLLSSLQQYHVEV
jgi:A/G-specific adenine glycosylase